MITIILNGEPRQVNSGATIEQILEELNLSQNRLAVEVNQDIVPRSEFSSRTFNEQDKVEIVQAIGGGSDY